MGDFSQLRQRAEQNSVVVSGIGCVAVLSGGSAARRATRIFTGSLWMKLTSSRCPLLQLCLALNSPRRTGRGGQGVDVAPVTTLLSLTPMLLGSGLR